MNFRKRKSSTLIYLNVEGIHEEQGRRSTDQVSAWPAGKGYLNGLQISLACFWESLVMVALFSFRCKVASFVFEPVFTDGGMNNVSN